MGKSKLDPDDIDLRDIFKTTISFKGEAKTFINELTNKKSDLVNFLVVNSLNSGVVIDFLKQYYTSDKVSELVKKYKIGISENKNHRVDNSKVIPIEEKKLSVNSDEIVTNSGESARLVLVKKPKKLNEEGKGEKKDGFDY